MAGSNLHNLVSQDCLVETAQKQRLVCCLLMGRKPGLYDLRTVARLSHTERDVKIAWAAPIQIILRGAR